MFYVLRPGTAQALARAFPGLYQFLLNKWYFDELYDFLFVRPAFALGRLFWKGGDGRIIDGLGPDGVAARVVDGATARHASSDRLHLPLCFRDADRRRGGRQLVRRRRHALMFGFGILSGLIFLPLVGAAFILTQRGDERVFVAQRSLGGAAHDDRDLRPVSRRLAAVRRVGRGVSADRGKGVVRFGPRLTSYGVDGFSMPFVLLTTFLMPFSILASWRSISQARRRNI